MPRRALVWLAVIVVCVGGCVIGGRVYLNSLGGSRATVETVADTPAIPAADPVGTCLRFDDDQRDGAIDGAKFWTVVACDEPHTADVIAHLDNPAGVGNDPGGWDRDDLAAVHDACDAAAAGVESELGDNPVISPAPRGDTVMCVATSDEHTHTDPDETTTSAPVDE